MSTLMIECPLCKNLSTIHSWVNADDPKNYGIENAPAIVLAEANEFSKKEQIECIHCNVTLYVQVVYAAQVRVFSDRERDVWRVE